MPYHYLYPAPTPFGVPLKQNTTPSFGAFPRMTGGMATPHWGGNIQATQLLVYSLVRFNPQNASVLEKFNRSEFLYHLQLLYNLQPAYRETCGLYSCCTQLCP